MSKKKVRSKKRGQPREVDDGDVVKDAPPPTSSSVSNASEEEEEEDKRPTTVVGGGGGDDGDDVDDDNDDGGSSSGDAEMTPPKEANDAATEPAKSDKKKKKKKKKKRKAAEVSDDGEEVQQQEQPKEETKAEEEGSKKKKKKKKNSKDDDKADVKADGEVDVEAKEEEEEEEEKESSEEGKDDDEKAGGGNEEKANFFAKGGSLEFSTLPLSDQTQKGLADQGFTRMTEIQSLSIGPLLSGKDLIGAAKTGSGKTLAFLVPVVELLHNAKFGTRNGTGAIVISPTRELAMQIYGVLRDLCTSGKHTQTYGLIMGGANRRTEAERLKKGVNIIVATPGRLLDHLQNTQGFNFRNLLALVMDEADRILEQGFEDDLRAIVRAIPKQRQTMLFSATQTKKVEDLARLSIDKNKAVYVEVASQTKLATVSTLEQGYVTVPSDKRFLLLFTFLKKNRNKKVMVFFSSCNSVKFHAELLNYVDVPVMDIHGRQKQQRRTTTFFQFCKADKGILCCTDVAARGLDIPAVDWIIQFDPPDDPKEYIHRVGRTARGASGSGRALLFLTPEETGFLRYLKAARVSLNEYEFPTKKVANVQSQLVRLIEKNYYLNRAARDAYRSYLLAYASHSLRDIFDVHNLDLQAVGTAFGFTSPPRVDLAFSHAKGGGGRNKGGGKGKQHGSGFQKQQQGGRRGGFNEDNPYGQKFSKDRRQFSK